MIETECNVQSGEITLAGTLCQPKEGNNSPLVIMVHGSGPLDRNENVGGFQLNVFNALAEHLAESGISSYRFDKRGCGKSGGKYITAGHLDLVNDVVACVDALSQRSEFKDQPVYLLGHSEGSLIAPQVSLKRPEIAGLILLCPFIEKLEPTLIRQGAQIEKEIATMKGFGGKVARLATRLIGSPAKMQTKLIKKFKNSTTDTVRFMGRKQNARWFRELLAIDPKAVFEQVRAPMLVIGGEKDVQCRPEDVALIASATEAEVECYVIDDMTHILRCDSEDANMGRYRQLVKKPIEPVVENLVSDWLRKQSGAQ